MAQGVSELGLGSSVCPFVCVQVCVWDWREGGGGKGRLSMVLSPWLNEVISRPLSICYRGSRGDQGVAMARWTQKGVAWEQVQGSGVRVRGSRVTASWTAHKRRPGWEKKEGKFDFLSLFFFLSFLGFFLLWRATLEEWTPLDINIELWGWDEKRGGSWRMKKVRRGMGFTERDPTATEALEGLFALYLTDG